MGERPDRHEHWQAGVDEMASRRASYTPERLAYYDRIGQACLAVLQPSGDVLDVGCGDGSMAGRLLGGSDVLSYSGIDVGPLPSPTHAAEHYEPGGRAEDVPYEDGAFDTVLLYSVLQHVEDPAKALAEAHRVLKPGGRLCLQASVNDKNPLFMWHWAPAEVLALIRGAGFAVEETAVLEGRLLCVRGRRV